jgi:hypothetical protein
VGRQPLLMEKKCVGSKITCFTEVHQYTALP